jgi:gamma-glutamylaminecyclotransferase
MAKILLFVYGTLKRGGCSHDLLADEEFLGEAHTLPLYRLYDCCDHPGLVRDAERGVAVQGEVWRVSKAALLCVDEYEDVPRLFRREAIALAGWTEPVMGYFYQGSIAALEDAGDSWPLAASGES